MLERGELKSSTVLEAVRLFHILASEEGDLPAFIPGRVRKRVAAQRLPVEFHVVEHKGKTFDVTLSGPGWCCYLRCLMLVKGANYAASADFCTVDFRGSEEVMTDDLFMVKFLL